MTASSPLDGISAQPLCRVTAGGYHPASPRHRRTGLCDLHHRDRAAAKSRWTSARSYHDAHPGSPDPGSWDEYETRIKWTPVSEVYTLLDPEARSIIRSTADALAAQTAVLVGFIDEDAWTSTDIGEFRMMAGRVLAAMGDAQYMLRRVAAEPDL